MKIIYRLTFLSQSFCHKKFFIMKLFVMKFSPMRIFFIKFFVSKRFFVMNFFCMKIKIFFISSKNHLEIFENLLEIFFLHHIQGRHGRHKSFILISVLKNDTVLKNQNQWRFLQWKGRFGLGQITRHPVRFQTTMLCSYLTMRSFTYSVT